jgi:molybdenum cofactor biosynthesis enzyme MoaA
MEKVDEAKAAALAIVEVAIVLQENQDKQFKQMMEMFNEMM